VRYRLDELWEFCGERLKDPKTFLWLTVALGSAATAAAPRRLRILDPGSAAMVGTDCGTVDTLGT